MKLKKGSKGKFVGLSSLFVMLAFLCTAVFCPGSTPVDAATTRSQRLKIDFVVRQALSQQRLTIDFFLNFLNPDGTLDYDKIAKQLGIDFYINEVIQLEMPEDSNVTLSAQPTASGTEISGDTSFSAGTTSALGLDIYIYSDGTTKLNGEATNALVGGNGNTIIATDNTDVKGVGGVQNNKWGYNLSKAADAADVSNLIFKGLQTVKQAQADAHGEGGLSDKEDFTLTFAAKIGLGVAPDTYSNTVAINAVPTPKQNTLMIDAMDEFQKSFDQAIAEDKEASEQLRQAEEINAVNQENLEVAE